MGQGLRRRPGHADPGRAGRAAAGPAARAGGRLPRAWSARTRWSPRSTTACTARAARRRRSTPRCTGWSTRRTSTTCTRTRGSRWPPRPTGRSSPRTCFGDRVVWVPWRRPGFQLGLDIAAVAAANPQAIGVILGGHGITAWGDDQRGGARRTRWRSSPRRRRTWTSTACAEPFGPVVAGQRAAARGGAARQGGRDLPDRSAGSPPPTGRRSGTTPTATWCWSSSPGRSSRRWPSWARPARTTSCAPRSSRWWWTCPRTASVEEIIARLRELHAAYRDDYRRLLRAPRHPGLAADARRRPGDRARARRRACSPSARTSRPPGSRASSTSTRST